MNNNPLQPSDAYLGTPVRTPQMMDEFKSADIINIDNSSITDSTGIYRQIQVAVTDPTTLLTVGATKAEVRVPFGGELVLAKASLTTPASAINTLCSLKNDGNQDILIGYLGIAPGSDISADGVVDKNKAMFSKDDPIRINVDQVGTGSKGLIVTLYFIVSQFYTQ